MTPKEKSQQALDLLREAVTELMAETPTLGGIELLRKLNLADKGIVISVRTILDVNRVDLAAIQGLPAKPCC